MQSERNNFQKKCRKIEKVKDFFARNFFPNIFSQNSQKIFFEKKIQLLLPFFLPQEKGQNYKFVKEVAKKSQTSDLRSKLVPKVST